MDSIILQILEGIDDKYTKLGATKEYGIYMKQDSMNAEETWMREPLLQCREKLTFYEEIFEFVIEDLRLIKKAYCF